MERIQKGERLRALLRHLQIQHHAVVMLALHLGLRVRDLLIGVVDVLLVLVVQIHVALFLLLVDKEDHVLGRDAV